MHDLQGMHGAPTGSKRLMEDSGRQLNGAGGKEAQCRRYIDACAACERKHIGCSATIRHNDVSCGGSSTLCA